MATPLPRASVILRCKNNAWVIDRTLAALFSQTFTDFELIVVDSGSTDATLEIASRYPHRRIDIAPGDYFPGAVLNQAIAAAQAPLLLFVNADCVPLTPTALERLVAAFDDPQVAAAFGRQAPRPEADGWVRRDYAASFPAAGSPPPWITLSLPIAAMRRSAWEGLPFYTDAWGSEDSQWGAQARARGWKVAYVPDALAMHSHNYTLRQLYGRRFIEGEADAFLHDADDTPLALARRALADLARDAVWMLPRRDFDGLIHAPARRAVSQWAYFVGRRHGARRRRTGDHDARRGQQVVLNRHESADHGKEAA